MKTKNFYFNIGQQDFGMTYGLTMCWGRMDVDLEHGIMIRPWRHAFCVSVDPIVFTDIGRAINRFLHTIIRVRWY